MRTLTSLYDHLLNAEATVRALVEEGIDPGDISLVANDTAHGWFVVDLPGAVAGGGLISALTGSGVTHEHAQAYAEGISRGGALVVVRVEADIAQQTDDILHEYSRVDMEDRIREYRAAGWEWSDDAVTPETTLRPKL